MFFYSNLFEPGIINPTQEQQLEVIRMGMNWLVAQGYNAIDIVCVANSYTKAGFDWNQKNLQWIDEQPLQSIAISAGSAAAAAFKMLICNFQALALVRICYHAAGNNLAAIGAALWWFKL